MERHGKTECNKCQKRENATALNNYYQAVDQHKAGDTGFFLVNLNMLLHKFIHPPLEISCKHQQQKTGTYEGTVALS